MSSPHQCVIFPYDAASTKNSYTMLTRYVCYLGNLSLQSVFIFPLPEHRGDFGGFIYFAEVSLKFKFTFFYDVNFISELVLHEYDLVPAKLFFS